MEKFIIIDGNSLVNRAYYALPPLTTPTGEFVQAVYGFATMLIKAIEDIKPKYIAVAFDLRAPTFRHKMYSGYKATRKGMPDELAAQMPILKEMLAEMNIKILEKEGYEADDIIGTMSKRNKVMTYIITGDRDSLQLIDDSTTVLLTKRGITDIVTVDAKELQASFGLTPRQVIEYKALAGDSSDNIPGVSGIGEKTAMNLLGQYEDVDGVYANLDKISGAIKTKLEKGKEQAQLSKNLATIDVNVPIDCPISECTYPYPFSEKVRAFFESMSFNRLLKRADIFSDKVAKEIAQMVKPTVQAILIKDYEQLSQALKTVKDTFALHIGEFVSFAASPETEYIINLTYSFFDEGLDIAKVVELIKPLLEDEQICKIVYDAKQLKTMLKSNFKTQLLCYEDVKLMQYLYDMTLPFEPVTALLKSHETDEGEIATGLLFIYKNLKNELQNANMSALYYDVELPLIEVLFDMEQRGFHINLKRLSELNKRFNERAERLEQQIFELSGQIFNIRSPKQLAKVLFEDMQLPYPKKTNNYSTGAEILEKLVEDHPIIELILDYRFVTKLNSTYIEGLKKLVDSKGVVHTEFKQMLTTTGRLSSVEPNLQNIPVREEEGKELRGMFISSEGKTLISADYSQIELRLMAHFSGDEIMRNAYMSGEDIHTSTAALVFGVDKNDVTTKMRRAAKAVNFGIIYGISEFGLGANLKISRYEAKKYIENYFDKFSGVRKYLDESVAIAKKSGKVVSLLGRERKLPELFSASYNVRQFGERAAMNMPLQGSAADIIKIAMVRVFAALKNLNSKLILQIHDELIVEADDSEIEQVKSIIKECMENAVALTIPLEVDVGVGKSWLDCK